MELEGVEGSLAEKTKEQRIKAELRTLKKMTEGMDKNRKHLALKEAERIAFMTVTLEDLERQINEEGCVEEYQNGRNQSGCKTTAAQQAYVSMEKTCAYARKRFEEMLPQGEPGGGALMEFLRDE